MIVGLFLLKIEIKPQCDAQTERQTDGRSDSAVKTMANWSCVRRCCGFWLNYWWRYFKFLPKARRTWWNKTEIK